MRGPIFRELRRSSESGSDAQSEIGGGMSNALTTELESLPALLIPAAVELIKIIKSAPNPSDAIERAKFYALVDAEKIAADELLKKALP